MTIGDEEGAFVVVVMTVEDGESLGKLLGCSVVVVSVVVEVVASVSVLPPLLLFDVVPPPEVLPPVPLLLLPPLPLLPPPPPLPPWSFNLASHPVKKKQPYSKPNSLKHSESRPLGQGRVHSVEAWNQSRPQ